jgi:hypothetical protein
VPRKPLAAVLDFLVYAVVWLVVGGFFVAAVPFADAAESWGREGRWVSGYLYVYALSLAGGWAMQIAAAALLRGLTAATGLNGVAHWLGLGAVFGVAVPWTAARTGYLLEGLHFPHEWQGVKSLLLFPLMAAMTYETYPVWMLMAAGAATAATVRVLLARRLSSAPRGAVEARHAR